jgi:ribose-phosphate pyrophosphokinase
VNLSNENYFRSSKQRLSPKRICANSIELVNVASKVFPDGESYVRLEGIVQNDHAVIIQTTCPPGADAKVFQLAFMADAAKRAGASKVTAIVPYLAYARQDKTFLQGEGISVETIAHMLGAAGINELITINIHSEPALHSWLSTKTVTAIPLLAEYFVKKGFKSAYALSPDKALCTSPNKPKNPWRRRWPPQQKHATATPAKQSKPAKA